MGLDLQQVINLLCDFGGDMMIGSGKIAILYPEFIMEACGKINNDVGLNHGARVKRATLAVAMLTHYTYFCFTMFSIIMPVC